MKKLHKTLTLVLALVMLLGIMAMPASAFDYDNAHYLIWTEEEFWDLSIARPETEVYMFILVKNGFDSSKLNGEDYAKYAGKAYGVTPTSAYSGSMNTNPNVQAAAKAAYDRITDAEYRAIIVDEFGLDIKADNTVTQPTDTAKPETSVSQPVIPAIPETTTTNVTSFSDVKPGDWYYTAVTEFAKTGLLAGYADGTFRPNNYITGGELATILCRIYGISDAELQETRDTINAHPDSSWMQNAQGTVNIDHWALPAMAVAYDRTGDIFRSRMTTYEFNRGNVMQALVVMASHSTWLDGTKPSYDESDEALKATIAGIPDVTYNELNVPERTYGFGGDDPLDRDRWSSRFIGLAYQMGIAHGVDSTGRCDPWGKVTRAQLVQMLYNLGITHSGQLESYSSRKAIEDANAAQAASGIITGGFASSSSSGSSK